MGYDKLKRCIIKPNTSVLHATLPATKAPGRFSLDWTENGRLSYRGSAPLVSIIETKNCSLLCMSLDFINTSISFLFGYEEFIKDEVACLKSQDLKCVEMITFCF